MGLASLKKLGETQSKKMKNRLYEVSKFCLNAWLCIRINSKKNLKYTSGENFILLMKVTCFVTIKTITQYF